MQELEMPEALRDVFHALSMVFDAEKHQALMEYADPKATPGTVGVVMKKGYTLNGRVLRAAEVGVIKK